MSPHRISSAFVAGLLAATASAQITNQDDCANSGVDVIGVGVFVYDNSAATTGPEGQTEAICYKFGTSGIDNDVWAVYTSTVTGSVTIDTCSAGGTNADTKLAAYPLAPCSQIAGTALDCNDDMCGGRSQISFNVSCGQSYLIQMGSFPSSPTGTAPLSVVETGTACAPGPIGTNYCSPATANSTGMPGVISALGFIASSTNDVTLTADQMPAGQFGYFLTSQTQGMFQPPGSSGFICLGSNIGRYNGNVGQGPSFSLQVDLTSMPVNPPQAVQPGETWNFQAWYRDIGGTNNFTDAVSITFQ